MKASELIEKLLRLIDKYGDLPVTYQLDDGTIEEADYILAFTADDRMLGGRSEATATAVRFELV